MSTPSNHSPSRRMNQHGSLSNGHGAKVKKQHVSIESLVHTDKGADENVVVPEFVEYYLKQYELSIQYALLVGTIPWWTFFILGVVGFTMLHAHTLTTWCLFSDLLRYSLVLGVGVTSCHTAFAHFFQPHIIARALGWPSVSTYQYEVAMMYAARSLLGFYCWLSHDTVWYATVILVSVHSCGIGIGHISMMKRRHKSLKLRQWQHLFGNLLMSVWLCTLVHLHMLFCRGTTSVTVFCAIIVVFTWIVLVVYTYVRVMELSVDH